MNVVVDHLKELMQVVPLSQTEYRPLPKENLSHRETQLFWRYHSRFANDFARAITECLPPTAKFIQYDHLNNTIKVEVL